MKLPLLAVLLALGFVALALASGQHRQGALVGASTAGLTGIASLFAMRRVGGRGLNGALAVMSLGFLVRLVLVAVGTILVVRAGQSVPGFIAGFFVPFFALAAVEAAYLHSLSRSTGSP